MLAEALDVCYAIAAEVDAQHAVEPKDDEEALGQFDPIRDGWVDRRGT